MTFRPTKLPHRLALATAAASFALVALAPAQALAADMLDQEAAPRTVVEFGTGWYIRGDISLNDAGSFNEKETAVPVPGTNDFRAEETDVTGVVGAEIAVGTRLSRNIRLDASYAYMGAGESETRQRTRNYRPPCDPAEVDAINTTTGIEFIDGTHRISNCVDIDSSSYSLQNLAVNAFYDFDTTILGARPFVGAGLGVIRNSFNTRTGDILCSPTPIERCIPNDGSAIPEKGDEFTQEGVRSNGVGYHLAGSLTAGFSVPVSEFITVDTSYKWTHMSEDAMWGGNSAVNAADIPTDFHAIKVGLRMDIF